MADNEIVQDELTEAQAGEAIGQLLLTDDPTEVEGANENTTEAEKQEVKFLAKKKAKKEKAEKKPEPEPEEVVEEEKEEVKEEADEPDDEDEDAAPVEMVRVKVDGIEQDVPKDEVVKSYQLQAHITRKSQALAEERTKFEREEVAQLRAERQEYLENIEILRQAAQEYMPTEEPDWASLRDTMAPEDFTQAFANFQVRRQRYEKVAVRQMEVQERAEADNKRALGAHLVREREKLLDAIPDLKDPEKGKAREADLYAYAASLGWSEQEVNSASDHRLLVLLDESRLYREAQKRKPNIEAKIDRAIQGIKPSSVKSKPRLAETERARESLAKTGSWEDAAVLINNLPEFRKK
ncbi:MAG: hypothetical protein O2854_07030 [Chloroflexi bacterium]|nr:hypothetical protein [Chloroflexota bacterium]